MGSTITPYGTWRAWIFAEIARASGSAAWIDAAAKNARSRNRDTSHLGSFQYRFYGVARRWKRISWPSSSTSFQPGSILRIVESGMPTGHNARLMYHFDR